LLRDPRYFGRDPDLEPSPAGAAGTLGTGTSDGNDCDGALGAAITPFVSVLLLDT
jgi:hypothetical protein